MGYVTIITVTLIGFLALAVALLYPVYRFLLREEEASRKWTREHLAERHGQAHVDEPNRSATESAGL